MSYKSSMTWPLLFTVLTAILLGACTQATETPPTPAGSEAGLPTFFYFYTDN